jgi:hypothetical protein
MDAILEPSSAARPGAGVLRLPPRALLLVAGVPGAGKTTMLARADTSGSLVLDPEHVRQAYLRRLGRLPYRLWRPLVHARHYLNVLAALGRRDGLVVHEPGTRACMRRLLARLAARAGRQPHLLLIDVGLHDALAGQRQRRRRMRRPAFQRHWRRWEALRRRRGGLPEEGWASVQLLDREDARRLRRIEIPAAPAG